MENKNLNTVSALVLAYLGDAVYESYIRDYLVKKNMNMKINDLHRLAVNYVSANQQSMIIHNILDRLSPEEVDVYKRGRNHKKATSAKNANIIDYKAATGFEALIGYLHLKRDEGRLVEVIQMSIECVESEKR